MSVSTELGQNLEGLSFERDTGLIIVTPKQTFMANFLAPLVHLTSQPGTKILAPMAIFKDFQERKLISSKRVLQDLITHQLLNKISSISPISFLHKRID